MQFLHEKNAAGQTLLRLCARGNAIIAEILRLSAYIPAPFLLATRADQKKYSHIILDFAYLDRQKGKGPDYYEQVIESNHALTSLDLEFKETYIRKLGRFYKLFEVIWTYGVDLKQYLKDVEGGHHLQSTLEGILLDRDGKQLLSEALYLSGAMLLLLDQKIPGVIRERLLISYLRYKGQTELEDVDEVAKLVERTGYLPPPNKSTGAYPESFFARVSLPRSNVKMIIGRLRSDDVYNQIPAYPVPEHRSIALATQASMLYVCLFFVPKILHTAEATMREVVDKHFPDNWIIPFYLGFTVDITVEWERYPAAKLALANVTQAKHITPLAMQYYKRIPKILKQLNFYLEEGTLTEEYILKNRVKLLEWLRAANVHLRWLTLHTRRSSKKILSYFPKIDQSSVLELLMKTSQFEFRLKENVEAILADKETRWNDSRRECVERINELAEVFSGQKALSRVGKNEALQKWFAEKIGPQVAALDYNDQTVSGRRIQQLMDALEGVTPYHQIETNVPVKNFITETRGYLGNMLRILNVSEDVMVTITLVSDVAYAREIVYEYIPQMQKRIQKDPRTVLLLRSTFLKLASILQIPLVRIGMASLTNEGMAQDMVSVSEFYSKELVGFVRTVLEIIPEMMFRILSEIIKLQTNYLKEIPMRIEKEEVGQFAQLKLRNTLTEKCFQVAQFTEGILALDSTLVGVIQIEPKQLLEEGIRRILVRQIAAYLDQILHFPKPTLQEFHSRLQQLKKVLEGFKHSFGYLQDYIHVYGLKLWQEEFQRIINFNVERECSQFLKQVHEGARCKYQNKLIPIPSPPPVAGDGSNNFIGRLGRALLHHTNVKRTVYVHKMGAWYTRNEQEVVSLKSFDLLIESVGVFGVAGLDKFYGFSIVKGLQLLLSKFDKAQKVNGGRLHNVLKAFTKRVEPLSSLPAHATSLYVDLLKQFPSKEVVDPFVFAIAEIGQKQLLRRHLSNIQSFRAKLQSHPLFSCLEQVNNSLLNDIRAHYSDPANNPYPSVDNPLLLELSSYLEHTGQNDPFSKIYVTGDRLTLLSVWLFALTLKQVAKFSFAIHQASALPSKKDSLDEAPFVIGMYTLLNQFHPSLLQQYLFLIGQYVRSYTDEVLEKSKAAKAYPSEVIKMLFFLEMFSFFGDLESEFLNEFVPAYVWQKFL
eukprot:TRINITY_DN9532_c0_g1_i1.p1 TRINITY_DN9532_c0_g1~~TRINITY_DN9532_c0_g1_i1.p1  ORF type:complete len:1160 (+),score=275.21 TRINITY_DN9532_c0_g1_i1:17-3496(+)